MAQARGFTHLLCGQIHVRPDAVGDDEVAASLAARQEGVAARWQLLELGVSRRAIEYRLRIRRFHRLFPGVYAIGHEAVTPAGRALGAVMACWPEAAASHETVLLLAGLIEPRTWQPHVTATQPRRRRSGLVAHRARLPPEDLTFVEGVPTTTLARAFLDIAPRHDPAWTRRRIKDAEFNKLLTITDLRHVLDRHPSWRGRGALATIIAPFIDDSRPTRSELEDRFLAFCRRRGLSLPETNVPLRINGRRYEPDALWRDARLVVELDGRDAHTRELAFNDDRARDRALIAAGWLPMRITWEQLEHDGDAIEADVRQARAYARGFSHTGGA